MEKMLQKMMKRFPLFIAMGFMMVVIALIIGAINSGNAADYFAQPKDIRESQAQWAKVRAGFESTVVWLPYFKFLGLAMILAGITMAVGVIATKLQTMGKGLMANVPQQAQVAIPPRPRTVMFMRMFMMLGMLIIIGGFIVALGTAANASEVYSVPVAELDQLATGDPLLKQLASVHANEAWLEAFKFVGVAFFFLAITNGLSTIIFALRYQKQAIPQVITRLRQPAATIAGDIVAP